MPVVCISGAPTEDEMKLTFTRDAIRSCDPFKDDVTIPGAVVAAIRWQASRSVADVCGFQLRLIEKLEREAERLWSSGECHNWFKDCDSEMRCIAGSVCGPLLEILAATIDHPDRECVNLFRHGNRTPCLHLCTCRGIMVFRRRSLWRLASVWTRHKV